MLSLVIRGATIIDGTGGPTFSADVGIDGDRIALVAASGAATASGESPTIDATGLVLTPGFIDVHSHADVSPLVHPEMTSILRQGVTSVVVGNCGFSAWPDYGWAEMLDLAYSPENLPTPGWDSFGDYLTAVDQSRPAVNVAALVGHGTIRGRVVGDSNRPADAAESALMRALACEAVDDGAVGLSSGLIYPPGQYASTDELIAVASGAAAAGGIYASHIRGEARNLFRSIAEALEIGAKADLPVHISHLKCESSYVWGQAATALAAVHDAGATTDQYPYTAWNSGLASLLPPWAPAGQLLHLLTDRDGKRQLRSAVEDGEPGFESGVDGVGWQNIVIESSSVEQASGRSVEEIANQRLEDPFDTFLHLLVADPTTSCIGHAMDDADVMTILADPRVFVASDGSAVSPTGPGGGLPVHPRNYGTFPRALALTRDRDLQRLESVVAKMTSLPADRFGLTGRGRVSVGGFADLVLIDPLGVQDTATFDNPHGFPTGIHSVVVNGSIAWQTDKPDAITRHGRALPSNHR